MGDPVTECVVTSVVQLIGVPAPCGAGGNTCTPRARNRLDCRLLATMLPRNSSSSNTAMTPAVMPITTTALASAISMGGMGGGGMGEGGKAGEGGGPSGTKGGGGGGGKWR